MLWKQISVGKQERVLIATNGEFAGILTPGDYRLSIAGRMALTLERHNVRNLVFESAWMEYLVKNRPALVRRHFTQIETSSLQVAMVYVNGKLFRVLFQASAYCSGAASLRSQPKWSK